TVAREVASGSLAAVELSDVSLVRPLGIVHKRKGQLTTAVQKFIELLQCGETAAGGEWGAAAPRNNQPSNGQRTKGSVHTRAGARSATLLAARRRRRKSKRI